MNPYYYDKIADDYHQKRKNPWRPLEDYIKGLSLQDQEFHGLSLDIGCANGRHFRLLKNNFNILVGIDTSFEFLKIARDTLRNRSLYSENISPHIHILQANVLNLPIRPKVVHNIFSIATIHHLENNRSRERAMDQIFQILNNNSNFLFTVWRKYQNKYRKYFLLDKIKRILIPRYKNLQESKGLEYHGDKYVPWTISKNSETHERFYHFFSKRELKKLLKKFKLMDISKMGGSTGKDNFFVFTKVLKN